MKKAFFPIFIIISLILSFVGPIDNVQAVTVYPLTDQDQDGMSNTMESNGWYNLTGGPYTTNPNVADSDQDGLTDAEEKLFNTNPNNPASPGIAVKYATSFKTFEYYRTNNPSYLKMQQGGDQYLLTEAAVLRRGTTNFKITGVNSNTATLTISGAGMTPITPVRDPARGGWFASIPSNGTVGTYTATITDGALIKSMPIYVIFELPTGLTQKEIEAYLYDDNPLNKRDEVSVFFRARDWQYYNNNSETPTPCLDGDPICSNWKYHQNFGYAQAFWTEQYTKKVLQTFTIPVIQGLTTTFNASQAISAKADQSVRVNYSSTFNSFSSATNYSFDPAFGYWMTGGACETNAGVYTSMLRSVGIAARPFNLDYNRVQMVNGVYPHGEIGTTSFYEYDHAVMMWANKGGDSNIWYAERTSTQSEEKYQTEPIWIGGTTGIRPLAEVGIYDPQHPLKQFGSFQDIKSDRIQSANAGWDWQNGSLGGGMVNTVWINGGIPDEEFDNPASPDRFLNRDYRWDSKEPLSMMYQSPYMDLFNCQLWKGDNWAPSEWYPKNSPLYASDPSGRTATQTYILPAGIPTTVGDLENWPYNPKPKGCSPSSVGTSDCIAFLAAWQPTCTSLPGQVFSTSTQSQEIQPAQSLALAPNSIQLGAIISDSGLDLDNDGRYDQLVIIFEITSEVAGEFQLGGLVRSGEKQIRSELTHVTLVEGLQTGQITFDGQLIGDNQTDGPFQIEAIWVAPAEQAVAGTVFPDEMTAFLTYSDNTQPYLANDFIVQAAYIASNFSYTTETNPVNGLIESITISVPLAVAIPDTFKVEGDLFDGRGEFVGYAEWIGDGSEAFLTYQVAGTQPPYSLEHVNLFDSQGKLLDARYAPLYTIDQSVDLETSQITLDNSAMLSVPQSVVPPTTFTATTSDTNANGRIDQLVISTTINVTTAGSYWMEGLLVNNYNHPVAWSVGTPKTLPIGSGQALQMMFDGRMLFDHLPLLGSQSFKLIAIKIFSGSPGAAVLQAEVPVPGFSTAAYSRSQLEFSVSESPLFQDDLESNATKWIVGAPWSRTNNVNNAYSGTYSLVTTGSASASGLLSIATPLNFTNSDSPRLIFKTAYRLSDGQSVLLEVSTNGTTWTTLKTFTGTSSYWSSESIDLSAYAHTANVRIRFNAKNYANLLWAIDEVFVHGSFIPELEVGDQKIFLPLVTRN